MEDWKRELEKLTERIEETEEHGTKEVTKYFDRLNDKLFSINNLVITGYLAVIILSKEGVNKWLIVLPILNFILLVAVDYYMMESNRKLSTAGSNRNQERAAMVKLSNRATTLSAVTIGTTICVIGLFIYIAFSIGIPIPCND